MKVSVTGACALTAVVSGALVYINLGKFLGPIAFANVYAFTRSYAVAFASVAVPALVALACLRAARRPPGLRRDAADESD